MTLIIPGFLQRSGGVVRKAWECGDDVIWSILRSQGRVWAPGQKGFPRGSGPFLTVRHHCPAHTGDETFRYRKEIVVTKFYSSSVSPKLSHCNAPLHRHSISILFPVKFPCTTKLQPCTNNFLRCTDIYGTILEKRRK